MCRGAAYCLGEEGVTVGNLQDVSLQFSEAVWVVPAPPQLVRLNSFRSSVSSCHTVVGQMGKHCRENKLLSISS